MPGRARPPFSAAAGAPGSLTWRPVPPGLTRAGTRLLSPSSPAAPRPQPGSPGGPVLTPRWRRRGRLTLALLRPAVSAGLTRPRLMLSLAEPSRTASLARYSPRAAGRVRSSVGPPLTFRNPQPLACPLLVPSGFVLSLTRPLGSSHPLPCPQHGVARRAVGSMFHSLLKHSARIETVPRSTSPDG